MPKKSYSPIYRALSFSTSFLCAISVAPFTAAQEDEKETLTDRQRTEAFVRSQTQRIDWIPVDELSPEQKEKLRPGCCGRYVEPQRTDSDAHLDPNQSELKIDADHSRIEDQSLYVIEGDVLLTRGSQQVEADRLTYDTVTGEAIAEGNVLLREPGLRICSNRANVKTQLNTVEVQDAEIVLYEAQLRAQADRAYRHSNANLNLSRVNLTSCDPGRNDWSVDAESVSVTQESIWGVAKDVKMRLYGVPILYSPFLTFPVTDDRLSGFLYPTLRQSESGGLDLSLPYYFNLAPNYDLILTPRYIRGRGKMLEGLGRHMSTQFYTEVSAAYLPNDEGANENSNALVDAGVIEEDDPNPFIGTDRWVLDINQQGRATADSPINWYSRVDFIRASDKEYFRELDNTSIEVSSQTHLRQFGEVGVGVDHWNFSASATGYQTLVYDIFEPYRELPKLSALGNYTLDDNWQLTLDHEWVRFEHSDEFDRSGVTDPDAPGRDIVIGDRSSLNYELLWDNQWVWGFFTPGMYLKHRQFDLDEKNLSETAETNQEYTIPQGSLHTGLFFEREGTAFSQGYIQTFEPELFYFYSDFQDQSDLLRVTDGGQIVDFDTAELTFSYNQLFQPQRFSGGDRVGDDNRLSVGLTTRFLNAETGAEWLRASIGQIYYGSERRVQLNSNTPENHTKSEIAGELSFSITDNFTSTWSALYDEEEQLMERGTVSFSYQNDDFLTINVGYNYQRMNDRITILTDEETDEPLRDESGAVIREITQTHTQQSDISVILPLNDRWTLFLKNIHDFTFDRELDSFGGIEYGSCCFRSRIIWRRWLDNEFVNIIDDEDLEFDNGVFFEIELRGLGGSGGQLQRVLSENIRGYSARAANLAR
ncbi:LPS-assembly protein LptD [Marinibactrum halimedae]|uniref:LPS-assembly protein LptD n=1 Tax=Marinibactrum halimedae TaxID=1444977 RepID=A0AA37T503_9GAMM|nr:LPS assembly protein LptD [Marinibactrum halimedae]MCD9459562.1 LPS assembly protein LptD [Marinibactrum halimedae]GLS25621.1 LPS-assembly protein LptD [Marinibactrum halimedae]